MGGLEVLVISDLHIDPYYGTPQVLRVKITV
jgi:hypothetical protein